MRSVLALSSPRSWATIVLVIILAVGPVLIAWRREIVRARQVARRPLANRYAQRRP